MNKVEKRILGGLYHHREMVGESQLYTAGEIRWLATHSLREGIDWQKDERLQTADQQPDPRVSHFGMVTAADERPLRYLEAKGFITREKMGKATNAIKLEVTAEGADYARQLRTVYGRTNLWYREHRDSLIGLLITIAVSAVTALITSRLTEPPRSPTRQPATAAEKNKTATPGPAKPAPAAAH